MSASARGWQARRLHPWPARQAYPTGCRWCAVVTWTCSGSPAPCVPSAAEPQFRPAPL